ncbi:MAG: FKBP-type peptidyl-prolyl cis-trans isomerase [Chitinophagaceae bacterium]
MKRILFYAFAMLALVALTVSCNNVSYKKTKSGLLYKIIPSNSKDSVVKADQWLKLNFTQKLNDSVMQTSYGKTPVYVKIPATVPEDYSPMEIFPLLRAGDSVVSVMMIDSLVQRGLIQQLPPFMKKGDKMNWTFKVLAVLPTDSLYLADQKVEAEKDAPRREKAEAEEMAKMRQQVMERKLADEAQMEKSGEAAKGIREMESYLKSHNITATKVGKGTYVVVKETGNGPQAADGKYVTVQYAGKLISNDSLFESGEFTRRLGQGELIGGMEEGLASFKEGGKGTLYVPGFRAYGANPNPQSGFKPFEPLKFEIILKSVADTMSAAASAQQMQQQR